MVSIGGNSLGGKIPAWAAISQISPSTRNGSAFRAITRRRLSPWATAGASAASVSGKAAIAGSHWLIVAKSRIKPPTTIRQAMSVEETKLKAGLDDAPAKGAPKPARLANLARAAAALLATFAVGFAGGYVAKWLHFPLPYMTGSLLVTAALGLA